MCFKLLASSKGVIIKKVLVGLSGGVDSTVTAILLQEAGFEVSGVYMIMHSLEELNRANIAKAKKVADYLGIDFFIHNIQDAFKDEVYDYFVQSYKEGLTPNPCVVCNRQIKFGKMVEFADSLGIEHIATGHYVRNIDGFIYKGLDSSKDQSYFLARVKKEVINRAIFPLGERMKNDVKEFAKKIPILQEIAEQKESSEICFVENSYTDILQEHTEIDMPGIVKNLEGKEVGTHKGFMHYTIGKRRGFFVKGAHEPHYVVDIDANENVLIVGKKEDLAKKEIVVGPWVGDTSCTPHMREKIKYFICMYHDQGLIAVKSMFFEESINVSLNLPIIRTSVDHGTAFDIAYKNKNPSNKSYINAIKEAVRLSTKD